MATAKDNGELSAMLLPELKKVAGQLGIEDAAAMKKADLVTAIADLQASNREAAKAEREAKRAERDARRKGGNKNSNKNTNDSANDESDEDEEDQGTNPNDSSGSNNDRNDRGNRNNRNDRNDRGNRRDRGDRNDRNNRFRDRGNREEREIQISEDDVLLPVGGLLDILDSYAFIRTGGYLASSNDVYVSLQQVRRYGLRKGDVITGSVRQPHEGERKEKFNALVRVETVNGADPET